MARFRAVQAARQKGMKGLAWASFIIAIVGGALIADMFLGTWIEFLLELLPWNWVAPILLLAAIITVVIDLVIDMVPNYAALIAAMIMPTVATAANGKLGDQVEKGAEAVLGWINDAMIEWLGTASTTGLAFACIIGSLLMARRVVKKSAGAGAHDGAIRIG